MAAHPLTVEALAAWERRETEAAVAAAVAAHADGAEGALVLACSIALRGYRADLLGDRIDDVVGMPPGVLRDGVLAMMQVGRGDLRGAITRMMPFVHDASLVEAEAADPLSREGVLLPQLLSYLATGGVASASWPYARECIDAVRALLARLAGEDGETVTIPAYLCFDLLGLDAMVELHTNGGDRAHRALTEAMAPLRVRNSLSSEHALALIALGSVEHVRGRLGEAALNLARGARLASLWRPGIRLHAEVELAFVRIRQGRWRDAAEVVRATTASRSSVEHDWLEPQALSVHGLMLAMQGDLEAAAPVLEHAALLCRDTPAYLAQMVLTHARIMVAITRSDWAGLRHTLEDASDPGYRHPYRPEEWRMLRMLAAWHQRRMDDLRAGVAEWKRSPGGQESSYYWAFVSILEEYDERYPAADAAIGQARARMSLDDDPLGRAWVRIVAGIFYSRFGARGRPDPGRALGVYEEASAELSELGAAGLAARYEQVVAATTADVLRTARDASPVAMLTDQQRRVAQAVAQGYTSGEIAGILHLSKRTVDYHVANIMRRLGVSNRREIGRALAE